ncbi:hypothetical protein C8Q73DRAFT_609081, partial [Cubamyces lactineus]
AKVRCRECHAKRPSCVECAVAGHRNLPFHWLEIWNGDFFEKTDLADAGFVLYLGHGGDPCCNIPRGELPAAFIVVHINGIHRVALHYCHCPGRLSDISQLVRADMFPASTERIETAFTCELLERYHIDFDVTKRSAQDFVRILTMLTPIDKETGKVKDRYREFMLAARVYRHLTMVKRAGPKFGVVIPGRTAQDLTVPCLTCPIPDFNLPDDWQDTPEHLRYLHRMILCADGNYHLQKKIKKVDENDVALSKGQGYFVPSEEVEPYLVKDYKTKGKGKTSKDVDDDMSIMCTGMRVARAQRSGKFKSVDVSGILSYTCDHLHFRPSATVDLRTTETWGANDCALARALRGTEKL